MTAHRWRWLAGGIAIGLALIGIPWGVWYAGALRDFRNVTDSGHRPGQFGGPVRGRPLPS